VVNMCRYAFKNYKSPYACFSCRKAFRGHGLTICPQCGGALHNLGKDFKVPRQRDVKGWQKVEQLYQHGIRFGSCGCGGPGYRPKRLNEVERFLATSEEVLRRKSEGERLLERFTPRK
jgi:hypothetical protein